VAKPAEEGPPQDPAPAPDAGLDQRVESLEHGQESLGQKLDRILGLMSGPGDDDPGDGGQPAGAPNIAHEIRQQLDERDRKAKADAEAASLKDQLGAVTAKVTELAEKPPAPMPRRVEKIMGWR
jgi:hypothetical protein